ncbi:aspartate carbamoyltransferase catalytic subunit [soil metagenome]
MTWTRRHLLDVEDFTSADLDLILDRAQQLAERPSGARPGPDSLPGHRVALLFAEPSTRTRLSFEIAARNMGAETFVLDPPASSMVKGETLADTARNLGAMGFGSLVIRHRRWGAPWVTARHFPGSVINAGDGAHAHPTQALLDLLTLRRALKADSLAGRKVVIVGDLLHSRVARSNIWTLTADGADVAVCGPAGLLRGFDVVARRLPGRLFVTDDLSAALAGADAVMALRIQRERMSGAALSVGEYVGRYRIDEARMALAGPAARFLHPGPINEGVEVTREVATGPRSLVLEQVRNGVPIRMAVLALLAATTRQEKRDESSERR